MSLFKINNEGHSPGTTHRIVSQAADGHGMYAHTLPILPKLYMIAQTLSTLVRHHGGQSDRNTM